MTRFHSILEFIRNFFNPPQLLYHDRTRKRRALEDPIEPLSPKYRRVQSPFGNDFLDFDRENYFLNPSNRRPTMYRPTKYLDSITLDDDDEVDNGDTKKKYSLNKASKYTSTPLNIQKTNTLDNEDDDDVSFVKEYKTVSAKQNESSKNGLNYIKPFSRKGIVKPKVALSLKDSSNGTNVSSGSSFNNVNASIRLDDKRNYKRLLELSNESSFYSTPLGKLFNFNVHNRSGKILNNALKTPHKEKMSTKDTIKKVLGDLENETIVLKDSDSDSDIEFVTPPSPKPDIKVEPVNSFKKIVDTHEQTKPEWLSQLINRHRELKDKRQREIEYYQECSNKCEKINKDIRIGLLTEKVNKVLEIKDAVLPEVEKEEEVELPLLTEEQLNMVNRAFKGDPNEILSSKFSLNISRRDILTLAGLNWLNDEVINFYMNMIIERGKNSKWPKSYAFNTFFYPKLIKDGPQSLRRWTKRVDLFSHDLICVPIHLGMHWCMAIIDFRNKSIRYFDSMGSTNDKCLKALRNYLEAEHMDKKKTSYDTSEFILENVKDIPQQMNGSDCGMFSCTFAEFITRNAKINFTQEHMPYLRKKMVIEIITGELLIQ